MTNPSSPSAVELKAWLVFSWEHNAFWRPKRCGYTRFIDKAGRYSREEAEAICRDADYRTYAEQKRADPETPPSEICFPAPEATAELEAQVALKDALLKEAREAMREARPFAEGCEPYNRRESVMQDKAIARFDEALAQIDATLASQEGSTNNG